MPFVAPRGSIVWLQVSTEGKYLLNNLIKELSQGIPGFFGVLHQDENGNWYFNYGIMQDKIQINEFETIKD